MIVLGILLVCLIFMLGLLFVFHCKISPQKPYIRMSLREVIEVDRLDPYRIDLYDDMIWVRIDSKDHKVKMSYFGFVGLICYALLHQTGVDNSEEEELKAKLQTELLLLKTDEEV